MLREMLMKRVAVALSGGVDSAVCAFLLKKKGFDVQCVFMRNWDGFDESGVCSASDELRDAKFVCEKLDVPLREVSFVKDYWNEVFTYLVDEYSNGFTPNPDIVCNKKIKFGSFFKYALNELGADAVATGHYARTSFGCYLERYAASEKAALLKAADDSKDQTFFLSQVPQESLRRVMFPLGELTKTEVRKIACENGLGAIARKPESMGICFIGSRNFQKFIGEYVPPKQGKIINVSTGREEGTHGGIHLWALGQRIRIAGLDKARYVVHKNKSSDILVGAGNDHPALLTDILYTCEPHWICHSPDLEYCFECDFRFQHLKSLTKCRIFRRGSGDLVVSLAKALNGVSPGQFAVFYKGNECLGSARITKTGPSFFSLGRDVDESFRGPVNGGRSSSSSSERECLTKTEFSTWNFIPTDANANCSCTAG